ncbi:MAG TPA: HEPN domain-containing protein [Prosthecobacter sp.]|nr:HEPN domain-containing protein [Prosthecobacter sp.]
MHNLLQGLFTEAAELTDFLTAAGQISLLRFASDNSKKAIVLSAASLFEHRVTEALLGYVDRISSSNECIISLVKIKAIKRQYHTYFDWENGKAGPFYALLGEVLGAQLKTECAKEPGKGRISAFLELGQLRNCLVHQNFAQYVIEKSSDEICALCEKADAFVDMVEDLLGVVGRSAQPPAAQPPAAQPPARGN